MSGCCNVWCPQLQSGIMCQEKLFQPPPSGSFFLTRKPYDPPPNSLSTTTRLQSAWVKALRCIAQFYSDHVIPQIDTAQSIFVPGSHNETGCGWICDDPHPNKYSSHLLAEAPPSSSNEGGGSTHFLFYCRLKKRKKRNLLPHHIASASASVGIGIAPHRIAYTIAWFSSK